MKVLNKYDVRNKRGKKKRMRKSKHFRKDVIIARIIAAIILIILMVIIHSLISVLFKPSKDKDEDKYKVESEYTPNGNRDTEQSEDTDVTIDTSSSENTETYVITTANVKFRSAPSTDSEVIGAINKNEKAILLEEKNGWYKVSYRGQEGYISADYSKILE